MSTGISAKATNRRSRPALRLRQLIGVLACRARLQVLESCLVEPDAVAIGKRIVGRVVEVDEVEVALVVRLDDRIAARGQICRFAPARDRGQKPFLRELRPPSVEK